MGNKKNKRYVRISAEERQRKTEERRATLHSESTTELTLLEKQQEAKRQYRSRQRLQQHETVTSDLTSKSADPFDNSGTRIRRWRKCYVITENMVNELHNPTHNTHPEEKKEVLRKLLEHYRIQHLLPEFARNVKEMENKIKMLDTVKSAYAHMQANRCISSESGASQKFISKTIGASRYCLRKAIKWRIHIDGTGDNIWGGLPRKRRCDAIDDADRDLIPSWWDTTTTISPIRKDVKKRRIGVRAYEVHATHYLQESQLDFYSRFKKEHNSCSVGLRAFERLKPYYVRRLKERNTCACEYHVEMVELMHGFNNMRTGSKGIHGRDCCCTCDKCENEGSICMADCRHFLGLTDMWTSILCPTLESPWHHPKCLT